jgi:hypothetical protein
MNALLITDLHLTANPRDDYRWKLFDWLQTTIISNSVKCLFILGDLTDQKDYHSGRLVNRVVGAFTHLYRCGCLVYIYIIPGNHDGDDPYMRFFKFLGKFPFIRFIETPWEEEIAGRTVRMLPHTRNAEADWSAVDMSSADLILTHVTVHKAVSESGVELEGVPVSLFRTARRAKIYSGDVHVPQIVGPVEYVGAPYPIKFGDKFTPRVVLLENMRKPKDLFPPSLSRVMLDLVPDDNKTYGLEKLARGDQVKVRLHLSRSQYVDWNRYKKNIMEGCAKFELELCGLELVKRDKVKIRLRGKAKTIGRTVEQVFADYCIQHKLDERMVEVGTQLMQP